MHQHLATVAEKANVATYAGGAAAVTAWGFHVNEICAIVSTLVAVGGFILQCYLVWHRRNNSR